MDRYQPEQHIQILPKHTSKSYIEEQCAKRDLIFMKYEESTVTYIDKPTGRLIGQSLQSFINRERPDGLWDESLVHHVCVAGVEGYCTPARAKYIDAFRSKDNSWCAVLECKTHGRFTMPVGRKDKDCPACATVEKPRAYNTDTIGLFRNVPGMLYVVKLEADGEVFCKVGITKHDVATRAPGAPAYSIVRTHEQHLSMYDAFMLEQCLHEEFKAYKYYPSKSFSGFSECFTLRAAPLILERLEHLLQEIETIDSGELIGDRRCGFFPF